MGSNQPKEPELSTPLATCTDPTRRVHELNIEQLHLDDLKDGSKLFDVRFNDRGFQKGDLAVLFGPYGDRHEYDITYVHSGLGIQPGYVILGLASALEE